MPLNRSRDGRLLLLVLDQAFDRKSWHGTNLRGSVRRVSVKDAGWRPQASRHNIWEIVVHAAYWKYVVWRRLTGQRRGSFPLKGSNWFHRPDVGTEQQWREDLALLDRMHRALREAVERLPQGAMWQTPKGSTVSNAAIVTGAAAHDLYHAGQIQLLRKLQSK